MEKYEMDGEVYYYRNGRWLDRRYLQVPDELSRKLNKLKIDEEVEPKSIDELFEYLYKTDFAGNTNLINGTIARILTKAKERDELKFVLPRLSSYYRQTGQSFRAIHLFEEYDEKYGRDIWSAPFFTSVAAAYCDQTDTDNATIFADRAMEIDGERCSEELGKVRERIKRIKANTKGRNGLYGSDADDDYIDDTFIPDFTWDD